MGKNGLVIVIPDTVDRQRLALFDTLFFHNPWTICGQIKFCTELSRNFPYYSIAFLQGLQEVLVVLFGHSYFVEGLVDYRIFVIGRQSVEKLGEIVLHA